MSALMDMPAVTECSVAGCSYNDHSSCHAAAVTITNASSCATFIPLTVKGGLSKVVTQVGACQRGDCTHNSALECSAPAVRIGSGSEAADCLTFAPRA